MTITEFLLARVSEDERYARDSLPDLKDADLSTFAQRMLTECEMKRQVLQLHDQEYSRWAGFKGAARQVTYCVNDREASPCNTLRLLAAVYAHHADHDQAWRP